MNDSADTDTRLQQLQQWLRAQGLPEGPLESASSDASFRRYFRLQADGVSRVVMDAPPQHEDCRPFVKVAALLHEAGLNAPRVLAQNLEQGFLLLSDLGTQTYLDVLNPGNADALMRSALDALVAWQAASRPGVLPRYDAALLERELRLFPDWYLAEHLRVTPTGAERRSLERCFDALVERSLAQTRVWVHRDYMPRNLMPGQPSPGILDFQDAVEGPVSYDVICLLRDAFLSWPQEQERGWLAYYHEQAAAAGVPVPRSAAAFWSDCTWMGVQRHLKVMGIFARIRYRDGKPRYLEDAPRFRDYLQRAAADEPALLELVDLVEAWHERAPAHG
ncbi:phosphotransferase [Aquisalimonas sp.]|uniref:aminoglycoside phosphotransferase family protein n=1 Tax=unclassified Aquisalimonas TaxID=2644645 RepID=UPI0025BCBB3F|nr:phosphotransferase [Aquisalimonas sp.]